MSIAIHCDTCDTWYRGTMAVGFLTVYWGERNLHFCSWACILKHAAAKEPITTVKTR